MAALELKVPPLLLAVLFSAAMGGLAYLAPSLDFAVPGSGFFSLCLLVMGSAVTTAGVIAFRRHRTTVSPLTPDASSAFVRTGVYAISRNPMYLGFVLWLTAFAVHLGNLVAFAMLPLFVAYMNRFQIVPEERALQKKFGEPFAEYMKSVRRWI
jgi:protein-S-isoprenylcysteine O-methyltransferase Ste14